MSVEKEQFIANINNRVKKILSKGGDEKLLMSLSKFMTSDLKNVIDSTASSEMDAYCQKYDGFYRLMKLLENLARGVADGSISVP